MKRVAILGCSGSVGQNALGLLADRRDRFAAVLLASRRSSGTVARLSASFPESLVALTEPEPGSLGALARPPITGPDAVLEGLEASSPDIVLNAITGAAGLPPSVWALRNGKRLALANKESMVMAGRLLRDLAQETGAEILPVDSEHAAVFECLQGSDPSTVRRIYLTASGGPFRDLPAEKFSSVTPEQALDHPTWKMGERITIGSATLMNKAFEIIEARWLFDLTPAQIRVLVHRQSVVHSMVEFVDGSILAQMGKPDMRVPILKALAHPERIPFDFEPFDPARFSKLTFEEVDQGRFPAIALGYSALGMGSAAGAAMNAADEVATERFLRREIPFPAITETVSVVLSRFRSREAGSLDRVYEVDREARAEATACLDSICRSR